MQKLRKFMIKSDNPRYDVYSTYRTIFAMVKWKYYAVKF